MINKEKGICNKYQTIISTVVTMLVFGFLTHTFIGMKAGNAENNNKWGILKSKSDYHSLMVSSYRDCREGSSNYANDGDTIYSCRSYSVMEANLNNIAQEKIKIIYNEMVMLSNEILER